VFVGLIHNNPRYGASDYKKDHKYQEDNAVGPFRSMKRLVCRNFNAVGNVDLSGRSRSNCNRAIRSPTRFGDSYTIFYIDSGFTLSCPKGSAVSTYQRTSVCEQNFTFEGISSYQPHEHLEASSHVEMFGHGPRHDSTFHIDGPFDFEHLFWLIPGRVRPFVIAFHHTESLKDGALAKASHPGLEQEARLRPVTQG
jgi:hypothetical protein